MTEQAARRSRARCLPRTNEHLVQLRRHRLLPTVAKAIESLGLETSDQSLAVQEILALGCEPTNEAIQAQIERFYGIAKDLPRGRLGRCCGRRKGTAQEDGTEWLQRVLRGNRKLPDLHAVFVVQDAHGLPMERLPDSGGNAMLGAALTQPVMRTAVGR